MRCRTEASRTETESTCHTTVSDSPDWSCTALSSRWMTLLDSVLGSENTFEYVLPATLPAVPAPNSAATHSRITSHLCRKHHRARAATIYPPSLYVLHMILSTDPLAPLQTQRS